MQMAGNTTRCLQRNLNRLLGDTVEREKWSTSTEFLVAHIGAMSTRLGLDNLVGTGTKRKTGKSGGVGLSVIC